MSKRESTYEQPRLYKLGQVRSMTLGQGGSSLDGNYTNDQRGSGNDGTGPHGG